MQSVTGRIPKLSDATKVIPIVPNRFRDSPINVNCGSKMSAAPWFIRQEPLVSGARPVRQVWSSSRVSRLTCRHDNEHLCVSYKTKPRKWEDASLLWSLVVEPRANPSTHPGAGLTLTSCGFSAAKPVHVPWPTYASSITQAGNPIRTALPCLADLSHAGFPLRLPHAQLASQSTPKIATLQSLHGRLASNCSGER